MSSPTATSSDPSPGQPADSNASPAGPSPVISSSGVSDESMERGSSILSEPIDVDLDTSLNLDSASIEQSMDTEVMDTSSGAPQPSSSSAPVEPARNPLPVLVAQRDEPRPPRENRRPPRMIPQPPTETKADFWHPLIDAHPWGHLVNPRAFNLSSLRESDVTNEMPVDDYRHLPDSGYLRYKFTKWLFPFVDVQRISRSERIPVIELQTLEAAVTFRWHSQDIRDALLDGDYHSVENTRPPTPAGEKPTLLLPPLLRGRRPVLYQVVAVNRGRGVILESKDFFVPGPDRPELQCVILDQYATNVQTDKRGFDKALVSVKDLVWVYTVEPSNQALRDPENALKRARSPRSYTLDDEAVFFFRVAEFAFITPQAAHSVMGHVIRILYKNNLPNRFSASFAGAPDSVMVTPAICSFDITEVVDDEMLLARSRYNLSTAIRFSEPAATVDARKTLCKNIRDTVPCHLRESILPLSVSKLGGFERVWLRDYNACFDNFVDNRRFAFEQMGQLFSAACSALAAYKSERDDRRAHWIEAVIRSIRVFPLQLSFVITGMAAENGWDKGRPVEFWIEGYPRTCRLTVHQASVNPVNRELSVTLIAPSWAHQMLVNATIRYGRRVDTRYHLRAAVRLGKVGASAEPAYELVSRMDIFSRIRDGSTAYRMVSRMYSATPATCSPTPENRVPPLPEDARSIMIRDTRIVLSEDQQKAVELGCANYSIIAIQAAFGTGKTVVGAIIAARLALLGGHKILVTASTNAAVAQFARTLLAFTELPQLNVVRFVSETAAADDTDPLPVDLDNILKNFGDDFAAVLGPEAKAICRRFREGRERYEYYRERMDEELTDQEREDYLMAEKDVSQTMSDMVALMFTHRSPHVICITTASLLNASGPKGLFEEYLPDFDTLICDEASQIPEPVLIAIANRLPQVRHICIGDVHQLEPHIRCARTSNPARYGARSVMDLLMTARAVPVASLVTTFRAHPRLNDLPNAFVYQGALQSGADANQRSLLLDLMQVPDGVTPFLFLSVAGNSARAPSRSYFNEAEAEVCRTIVTRLLHRHVSPAAISILSFYKEQMRRLADFAREHHIELATVDSIQGREKDIVILLTTRTDFEPSSGDFLDDQKRMNVALTRSRQGLFVLGHIDSLRRINFWNRVLAWAEERRAVVPASQLDIYLPPEQRA